MKSLLGKYVITNLSPILFNENIIHNEVVNFAELHKAKSAGFFLIKPNPSSEGGFDVICYGESESLGVKCNEQEDPVEIKKMLLNQVPSLYF